MNSLIATLLVCSVVVNFAQWVYLISNPAQFTQADLNAYYEMALRHVQARFEQVLDEETSI